MRESDIQNAARIALSPYGTYFRANVGQGWVGVPTKVNREGWFHVPAGSVILTQARPFNTGLPAGFPDTFGFTIVNGIPIFTGIEFKTETGRIRPEQEHMIKFLLSKGCLAGVARSPAEAVRIVRHD